MSSPLVYAELLRSLNQVSVFVDLPTPVTASSNTHLELADLGSSLTLYHGPDRQQQKWDISIQLPSCVKPLPKSSMLLHIPVGATSWSVKLPVLPSGDSDSRRETNYVPWSAPELNSLQPGFSCARCHVTVLGRDRIRSWKDLPSENWAEMMDFWHCHKPPHGKGEDLEKGESLTLAKERNAGKTMGGFVPTQGVGLVGLTYFLVNMVDCIGVDVVWSEETRVGRKRSARCSQCKTLLSLEETHEGIYDGPATDTDHDESSAGETLRLNKWSLCIIHSSPPVSTANPSPTIESYSPTPFLSAHLISLTIDLAIRRFRLIPDSGLPGFPPNPSQALHIWVFHPDKLFASVFQGEITPPMRGMKVYYSKGSGVVNGDEGLVRGTQGMVEEDLVVPREALEEVVEKLERSTEGLPKAMREFMGWKSGNLERFDINK